MRPFHRYLLAKRTVDDRALNREVFRQLQIRLEAIARPLRILEVGAGLGTMLARLVDWGALRHGEYTLLDADAETLELAPRVLARWAAKRGLHWQAAGQGFLLHGPEVHLRVSLLQADLYDNFAAPATYDLLIAHAVMDLVHLPVALPHLFHRLRPQGLAYLTLNFDGLTLFLPRLDHLPEARLLERYHHTMETRTHRGLPAGTAHTGRELFRQLPRAGAAILVAGASDWVVYPTPSGAYPHDEAFFLTFILHTIYQALREQGGADPMLVETWYAARRAHLQQGRLIYIAHQLDFLALWPGSA